MAKKLIAYDCWNDSNSFRLIVIRQNHSHRGGQRRSEIRKLKTNQGTGKRETEKRRIDKNKHREQENRKKTHKKGRKEKGKGRGI